MKHYLTLAIIALSVLTSCGTFVHISSGGKYQDGIYYKASKASVEDVVVNVPDSGNVNVNVYHNYTIWDPWCWGAGVGFYGTYSGLYFRWRDPWHWRGPFWHDPYWYDPYWHDPFWRDPWYRPYPYHPGGGYVYRDKGYVVKGNPNVSHNRVSGPSAGSSSFSASGVRLGSGSSSYGGGSKYKTSSMNEPAITHQRVSGSSTSGRDQSTRSSTERSWSGSRSYSGGSGFSGSSSSYRSGGSSGGSFSGGGSSSRGGAGRR